MNALERAVSLRDCGRVVFGIRDWRPLTLGLVAAEFGLSSAANVYEEILREEATAVLTAVLHKDMAYNCEIMLLEQANALAADVISLFEANGARFFTNGGYGRPRLNPNVGPGWMAATEATFDTGVLVLAPSSCACLWFMDED